MVQITMSRLVYGCQQHGGRLDSTERLFVKITANFLWNYRQFSSSVSICLIVYPLNIAGYPLLLINATIEMILIKCFLVFSLVLLCFLTLKTDGQSEEEFENGAIERVDDADKQYKRACFVWTRSRKCKRGIQRPRLNVSGRKGLI